jgi:hypothetical protein
MRKSGWLEDEEVRPRGGRGGHAERRMKRSDWEEYEKVRNGCRMKGSGCWVRMRGSDCWAKDEGSGLMKDNRFRLLDRV